MPVLNTPTPSGERLLYELGLDLRWALVLEEEEIECAAGESSIHQLVEQITATTPRGGLGRAVWQNLHERAHDAGLLPTCPHAPGYDWEPLRGRLYL